jgi:hypothetical protein
MFTETISVNGFAQSLSPETMAQRTMADTGLTGAIWSASSAAKEGSEMRKPTTRLTAIEATAPSHWAPYFINGDASGLYEDERVAADAFLERMAMGSPVSCEDAGFRHRHDAMIESPLAADCQTYVWLVETDIEDGE